MGDKYPSFGSGLYGTDRAPTIIGNEEPMLIESRQRKAVLWAGIKYAFSGAQTSGASGWNFYSGEIDIEPPSASGWGQIRIPELNTVHNAIIIPRMPLKCAVGYPASGVGGASGNMLMCQWVDLTYQLAFIAASGTSGTGTTLSGTIYWNSGLIVSGLVDVWAIGTR